MQLVIPSWLDALAGGALLYGALALLTPHLTGKRRLAAFLLLVLAIYALMSVVVTIRIG